MKIYGGHDYYDCGMALGRDPSVTLIRGKSRDVPVREADGSLLLERQLEIRGDEGRCLIPDIGQSIAVVFCEKVYRGALIPVAGAWEGVWSADKLLAWGEFRKKEKRPVTIRVRGVGWWPRKKPAEEEKLIRSYFTPTDVSEALRRWMILNRVSIMVEQQPERGEDRRFQINPYDLKKLGFAKAIDPYTAFQELSMWIGGVLGGTSPEIVTIEDDKVLIENHGFDGRTSFRGPRLP
jgi:hypothetical protein